MNIDSILLPKLNESELKFAYESISNTIAKRNIDSIGKTDITESIEILEKYYDKSNPILNINDVLPMCGWTPLSMAAYYGNYVALKSLLKNGADPEIALDEYSYPLHLACGKGHETCVMYLIKAGADINKRDKSDKTAFMRACERNDLKRTMLDYFFNGKLTDQKIDLNQQIDDKNYLEVCLEIAKTKGSEDFAKALSYMSLQMKLKPKNTSEKRVKI